MSVEPASVFDSSEASPGLLLWRVTLAWQRAMRSALGPHDLTHVQFVLLASTWWLEEHEGAPSQRRIAAHAGTDPMMTSQVVRKLEDRGLLSREADPRDSRARSVGLTGQGRKVLTGALADVEAADAAYFGTLGSRADAFVAGLHLLDTSRAEGPAF